MITVTKQAHYIEKLNQTELDKIRTLFQLESQHAPPLIHDLGSICCELTKILTTECLRSQMIVYKIKPLFLVLLILL